MLYLAFVLAAQFAADALPAGTYDGQCLYPEAVRERAAGTVLASCNRAVVGQRGVAFVTRGTSQQIQFRGAWEGNRLTVKSVVLRGGGRVEVRGLCQLYETNERLSTIACTAVGSGNRSYAANFMASRINNAR